MAKIKIKTRNWRGDKIAADVKQAGARGLFKAASHILDESVRIAPKDEGTLIQTAGVDVDEEKGQASIYYTQPYARRLHESQSMNFQGGRQNKYLEKPMLQEDEAVQQILANELKDVFKG